MYLAGVTCEGCHMALPGHQAARPHARRRSPACPATARATGRSSRAGRRAPPGAARRCRRQLDATARAVGAARIGPARRRRGTTSTWSRRATACTTSRYTYALLRQAHEDMNEARQGERLAALPRPVGRAAVRVALHGLPHRHRGAEGRDLRPLVRARSPRRAARSSTAPTATARTSSGRRARSCASTPQAASRATTRSRRRLA